MLPPTLPSSGSLSQDVEIDPLTLSDLTALPSSITLTPEDVLSILRARFLDALPYTWVSPRVLLAVNLNQLVQINADAALGEWAADFADCGRDGVRGTLGPHVWAMSGKAYYYMRRTGQDQTILLSGETGSGKSETGRLLVKSLIDLAAPPPGKRGAKLSTSIPAASFVLDSFGNATTIANSNASRFGRYSELQFSDKGRLVGVKGLEYYLEKSRVTGVSAGERNFHVFYYLVAGATPDEREHLRLEESTSFRYLSHHRTSTSSNLADAVKFNQLKEAFKTVGFPKKAVASICQILSAILHLGNLDFVVDRSKNMDSAIVKNPHVLDIVAEFLGVDSPSLEATLVNKSMLVGGEMCGVFLDAEGAAANRDDLARALYGLVFSWIGEYLNEKLCRDDFSTFISVVDFAGPAQSSSSHREGYSIDAFCVNLASERLRAFALEQLFEADKADYVAENVASLLPSLDTRYNSNTECIRLLTNTPGGLVHIVDDQSRRKGKTDSTMLKAMSKRWGNHSSFGSRDGDDGLGRPGTFLCAHWDGPVTYSVDNFLSHNSSAVSPTFVSLLGGSAPSVGIDGRSTPGARDQLSTGGSSLSFVRQLFTSGAVETVVHPKSEETIVGASQKVGPRRAPSTRRPKGRATALAVTDTEDDEVATKGATTSGRSIVNEFNDSLFLLLATLADTKSWHVFCLRPNDAQLPNQVDAKLLKHQIRALGIAELAKRLQGEWSASVEHKELWDRYRAIPPIAEEGSTLAPLMYRDKALRCREILGWSEREMAVGRNKVFLSDAAFRQLEDFLRVDDVDEQQRSQDRARREASAVMEDPYSPYLLERPAMQGYNRNYAQTTSTAALPLVDKNGGAHGAFDDEYGDFDHKTDAGDDEFLNADRSNYDEERSVAPSDYGKPMFDARNMPEKDVRGVEEEEVVEEVRDTAARNRWVALTWLFTWWIPSPFLSWCGGMKRRDVRMAWREKLLINMLIWLLCGSAVFVIAIMGNLICPKEYIYSTQELVGASLNSDPDHMLVEIRGEAFDLTNFAPIHQPGISVIPLRSIQRYGGTDASSIFPVQVSALCNGVDGTISPWITLDIRNSSNTVAQYHDFRAFTSDSRPDWYYETMIYLRYNFRKGFIGYTPSEISKKAKAGNVIAIYEGGVYDLTSYVSNSGGGISVPEGTSAGNINRAFMSSDVVSLFQTRTGGDLTNSLNSLNIDANVLAAQKICLRNLFFVGKVDHRNSAQCQFSRYILLALSIVMVAIIGFKFLAALQFGRRRKPEDYDKFVICQVPCYTEGEESLRNCINSLTRLKYDDKRKLLFIICDGMIVGSGNDRPTPTIVLDILGADTTIDPEPLSFQSIGDGAKQHNMAKVYSGLHEAAGHIVPYIVIVKVGKPSERSRPGNRGKRDSQMLLMRFLNRVHFDTPMAPCELEIYHQIKNVIGVNPSFYEYLLMIDADTVVDPLSLNYLVGSFVEDKKVIGLCGETSLSNAKASWTTMSQVYEYFISHYLSKAFESLFGSVTCLPGCFSMYRIRTLEHRPLIISNALIREYGINRVETLHVKNLLSLGEDRYLTTVVMKEFPEFKTKFCKDAQAKTIAPDDWKVLMSQRRRWINSTVHNLAELLFVDRLCGFCCFSMRFIVFIDFLSTLIAPVTVAYIGYLIYLVAAEGKPIPTTALIMLGAVYGLQAIIFILHRKFEHIGWMIIYILAIPFFSFILPLMSFWQMDDFSWGSTREIVGEKGKRVIIHDDGKFDPASIPLKSWADFENELWEQGSNQSIGSLIAASKRDDTDSRYGHESTYQPQPYGASGSRHRSMAFDQQSQLGRQSQYGQHSQYGSPNAFAQQHSRGPSGSGSQFFSGSNLALQEMGRPASQAYSSSPRAMSPVPSRALTPAPGGGAMGFLPSDEAIVADVHRILATANLQTLTKKGVRQELEAMYGAELGARKAMVNREIEVALGL